jgi:hypothetical protein
MHRQEAMDEQTPNNYQQQQKPKEKFKEPKIKSKKHRRLGQKRSAATGGHRVSPVAPVLF